MTNEEFVALDLSSNSISNLIEKCSNLKAGMFLPRCPELHFGAVQLLGHGHLVDLQVDLALGIVIWKILVCRLHFGGVGLNTHYV